MNENESIKKERIVAWLQPQAIKQMEDLISAKGMKNHTEFIAEAVDFYVGYLSTENAMGYLPELLVGGLKNLLHENDVRVGNNLFRLTTEISMMANILAVGLDVEDDDLVQLRKKCVADIKKNRGRNIVDQAVAFQRDEEY